MRIITLATLCFASAISVSSSEASIQIFTDRAAWEAAAGLTSTNDLNDEIAGLFTTRDFGDFVVTNTAPSSSSQGTVTGTLRAGVQADNNALPGFFPDTDIDGTNHIVFQSAFTQSPLRFDLDDATTAFGFDWRTTDSSNDGLDFSVVGDAVLFSVSPGAPNNGFFGIVDAMGGLFSSFNVQDDIDGGGFNDGVGIDNISFAVSPSSSAVPEPTMFLTWVGLACFSTLAMRRRA